jgi:hypothetical protein
MNMKSLYHPDDMLKWIFCDLMFFWYLIATLLREECNVILCCGLSATMKSDRQVVCK